jgi:ABC-type glycerol-3-phosphate transport system substrate-binding protein
LKAGINNRKPIKNKNMKFVKFGIFALSMGLFVASCGDTTTEEGTDVDTTVVVTEPAPVVVDTMMAAPASDTTMMVTTDTTVKH